VRRGDWRRAIQPAGQAPDCQLFNLDDDPNELHDLADAPEHEAVRRELISRLHADGWSAADVQLIRAERAPDQACLARWTQAVEPRDAIQWGLPAPL